MKYMGSKSRISKSIVPIIQELIDENEISLYIEPFCGGCNVIDKIKCDRKIASDINVYLIDLFKYIQNDGKLYEECDKDMYNKVRDSYNNKDLNYKNWEIGNIGFFASYNGRFFDGGYAKTVIEKTKNGDRIRDYYKESLNNAMKQKENLKDIEFICKDYREFNPINCLIYLDPPYKNVKQYKNSSNFNYEEFWEVVRKWSKMNIVIISELEAPNDFECIWEQSVTRSVKVKQKSQATEKLFMIKGE